MKTPLLKYSPVIALLLIQISTSFSQESIPFEEYNIPNEHLEIITDRDIYSINEEIYFKIYNTSPQPLKKMDWSRVAYLELIASDGHAFIQKKFKLDSLGCESAIKIPPEMLTGNYYLRAYTKWMRNFSPYTYTYKLITVINAGNNTILLRNTALTDKFTPYDSLKQTNKNLIIKPDKKIYNSGDTVDLTITPGDVSFQPGKFTLSVVKKDVLVFTSISLKPKNNPFHFQFVPETKGLSISGRIINESDSAGLENKLVHLTMLSKDPYNIGCLSADNGKYYFSLPDNYSTTEFFLNTPPGENGSIPSILVDNDFCQRKLELPFIPVILSEKMLKVYDEISINSQINQRFFPANPTSIQDSFDIGKKNYPSFYGQPDFVIQLDKFIPLPTLEDYFDELIPYVSVRQEKAEKYFQVLGAHHDLKIYEPLVMVDFVAISEASKVLAIVPKKVKQIDVINRPFIKGNIIYGGVINIISRSGDFAGAELPVSGQFFKFSMFEPSKKTCYHNAINDKHIPAPWNCLYWNASVDLAFGQIQKVAFQCGDTKGEYLVIIRGFDSQGKPVNYFDTFMVQ